MLLGVVIGGVEFGINPDKTSNCKTREERSSYYFKPEVVVRKSREQIFSENIFKVKKVSCEQEIRCV